MNIPGSDFVQGVWDWSNPVSLIGGVGAVDRLADIVPAGQVLLVTTQGFVRRGGASRIVALLSTREVTVWDGVRPNPDRQVLDKVVESYRKERFAAIVALGGGSAIDSAKAIAAGLGGQAGDVTSVIEGRIIPTTSPPVVAIPTTAGTGSEVTPFATVWDYQARKKLSLSGLHVFPSHALLDPALTIDGPRHVTIAAGLDALSQACESIWSRRANPVTISFALRAARLAMDYLPVVALADPTGLEGRGAMQGASVLAGMAISHTRTAIAHSISYPLTAHFGLPHGVACSFTLPAVLLFNLEADDGRLELLARATGNDSVAGLADRIRDLLETLDVPRVVAGAGVTRSNIEPLQAELLSPGRSDNNMRPVSPTSALGLLRESIT